MVALTTARSGFRFSFGPSNNCPVLTFFFEPHPPRSLSQYGIAVCKKCLCAVWPSQAYAHLTSKAHCLPKYEARSIANDLDTWQALCSQREFQLPNLSVEYISELSLYHDGLRCLLQQDDVPTQLCRVHGRSVPLVRRWLSS